MEEKKHNHISHGPVQPFLMINRHLRNMLVNEKIWSSLLLEGQITIYILIDDDTAPCSRHDMRLLIT